MRERSEICLKDIVDSSLSESMTAGLAKYAQGMSIDWTLDYDEYIVFISGNFTIYSEGKSSTLKAGDFFFITHGTTVKYRLIRHLYWYTLLTVLGGKQRIRPAGSSFLSMIFRYHYLLLELT